jgi:hypothetical protein
LLHSFALGSQIEQRPGTGDQEHAKSRIVEGAEARSEYEAGLSVRNTDKDGRWDALGRRRKVEIKKSRICHETPQQTEFPPRGMALHRF